MPSPIPPPGPPGWAMSWPQAIAPNRAITASLHFIRVAPFCSIETQECSFLPILHLGTSVLPWFRHDVAVQSLPVRDPVIPAGLRVAWNSHCVHQTNENAARVVSY